MIRIAAIGDVHGRWSDADRRWFDASDYDLLLFVGDLATYRRDGRAVARSIALLRKPTLFMPGNHDAVSLPHLAAEAFGRRNLIRILEVDQGRRRRKLAEALDPLEMAGYSIHPFRVGDRSVTVIAARPHSMGGPTLSFRRLLARKYGVDSLEASARRLCELVDQVTGDIVFLAHNGPAGLGDKRDAIWGCDFRKDEGDFGDPDLAKAVAHARRTGKAVRAVVAGHMHHHLKGGGERQWHVERDGVMYVNAARVPRIERSARRHHHVRVTLNDDRCEVEAVQVQL